MSTTETQLEAATVAAPHATSAVTEPARRRRSRPSGESVRERLAPLARQRLDLLRRSRVNLRRHFRRAVIRVGVLVLFDLGMFWLLRAGIRALRDYDMGPPGVTAFLQTYLPRGYLSGWQFGAALLISLVVVGSYGQGDARRDPGRLLAGCALAVALPLWMPLWTHSAELVLMQYLLTVALVWGALVVDRFTVDRIVGVIRDPRKDAARTVFVGTREACTSAAASPAFRGAVDTRVLGWVEVGPDHSPDSLGRVEDLPAILETNHVETVVLAGLTRDAEFEHAVEVSLTAGCHLLALPHEAEFAGVSPSVVWRSDEPVIELHPVALRWQQLALKRATDLVLATMGIVLLSPLIALIALAIRLDSPGPVFFSQERIGLGGRRFRMLKFRSMRLGADARKAELASLNHTGDPRLFKIPNDPRVTRVGAWLRKSSLDELPQLLNVVVGTMSLVGPRPFFESDLAGYELHHFVRFEARPGITGLWQVSGRSAVKDFEEVIRLDREYIRNWSLWLDLTILARTVPAVVRRHGAY
jgi:exopolysaccharide biosynthesis polyprenyl glycosylphosphotransferase